MCGEDELQPLLLFEQVGYFRLQGGFFLFQLVRLLEIHIRQHPCWKTHKQWARVTARLFTYSLQRVCEFPPPVAALCCSHFIPLPPYPFFLFLLWRQLGGKRNSSVIALEKPAISSASNLLNPSPAQPLKNGKRMFPCNASKNRPLLHTRCDLNIN